MLAAAAVLTRGFDDASKSLSVSMMWSSWAAVVDDFVAVRRPRVDVNVSSFSVSLSHRINPTNNSLSSANNISHTSSSLSRQILSG